MTCEYRPVVQRAWHNIHFARLGPYMRYLLMWLLLAFSSEIINKLKNHDEDAWKTTIIIETLIRALHKGKFYGPEILSSRLFFEWVIFHFQTFGSKSALVESHILRDSGASLRSNSWSPIRCWLELDFEAFSRYEPLQYNLRLWEWAKILLCHAEEPDPSEKWA